LSKTLQVIIAIAVILILIVGTSLISKIILTNTSEELVNYVNEIADSIESENWDQANYIVPEIEESWSNTQKKWAMLIDHTEIDNINSSMFRMIKLLETREKNMALIEASVLRQFIEHIPDKTAFYLENVF